MDNLNDNLIMYESLTYAIGILVFLGLFFYVLKKEK